eukprot:jgi/Mesvir1/611/Mv02045-RA.1
MSEPENSDAIVAKFTQLRTELNQLWTKMNTLDAQFNEHKLVVAAMGPMEKERKCYRLIGAVLVERTVGEVLPAVTENMNRIEEVLKKYGEQLELKKKELSDFQSKYKIRVRGEGQQNDGQKAEKTQQQGVLV